MKVIFLGTPQFACPILETLSQANGIEILAVVTQPDRKSGRSQKLTPPPIKRLATELNLKVLQPQNSEQLYQQIKNLKPDFLVLVAYGLMLNKDVLELPKVAPVNIHLSLLPKYRGASPVQQSILNGDKRTGITIMKMTSELDKGPVYLLKKLEIQELDNLETLTNSLARLAATLIVPALNDISQNHLPPLRQDESKASYTKKINKKDGKISFKASAEQINNKIRAFTPWPSAFTELQGKKIKIIEASYENNSTSQEPGKWFQDQELLKIATGEGNLIPKKLQIEGKKPMSPKDFLNGYKSLID